MVGDLEYIQIGRHGVGFGVVGTVVGDVVVVGRAVGRYVSPTFVGPGVGSRVGTTVGLVVGLADGATLVGFAVGLVVGLMDGDTLVGLALGLVDGFGGHTARAQVLLHQAWQGRDAKAQSVRIQCNRDAVNIDESRVWCSSADGSSSWNQC